MRKIERAGVVIKPHAPEVENVLSNLVRFFEEKGISCILEEAAARKLGWEGGLPRDKVPESVDLVIILGGDGTLLSVAHLAAQHSVPVLGVNLGRLGFLTEVPREEMLLALESFLSGNQEIISRRRLLEAQYKDRTFYCLNDVVVNKGALARMIQIQIWIDGKQIAVLKADGIIVSTPTGSTAYSLAAGGPIIQPYIPAILIAPICPHTLTFRPMVISGDSTVKLQLMTSGEEVYLTLDGQRGGQMIKNDIVEIRMAQNMELQLISSPRRNYFDLLQEKLGWAE